MVKYNHMKWNFKKITTIIICLRCVFRLLLVRSLSQERVESRFDKLLPQLQVQSVMMIIVITKVTNSLSTTKLFYETSMHDGILQERTEWDLSKLQIVFTQRSFSVKECCMLEFPRKRRVGDWNLLARHLFLSSTTPPCFTIVIVITNFNLFSITIISKIKNKFTSSLSMNSGRLLVPWPSWVVRTRLFSKFSWNTKFWCWIRQKNCIQSNWINSHLIDFVYFCNYISAILTRLLKIGSVGLWWSWLRCYR